MGAMQPFNVILHKVDGGIQICVIDLVASPRAIKNAELHCLADRVRAPITRTVEAV